MVMDDDTAADVRIVLIGDAGTGKTSLIMALLEDEFVSQVPVRMDRIVIPPDVTPENVVTAIVDTSLRDQNDPALRAQISAASVLCIVYDVNDDQSIRRVADHWLPFVRDVLGASHQRPVVLVGNKSDDPTETHTDRILPTMERFAEVDTCVECSAKSMKNVSEIFYYAQKAVVYPIAPLYNADEKRMTERCRRALVRVFKLCDRGNDGLLDDAELNDFQTLCFGCPLTAAAIEDVKRAVADGTPDGVQSDAISLSGFLYLNQLFIERGRHETTWAIMRKFGYGQDLALADHIMYPDFKVPVGCSTELAPEGLQFLTALFEKHDEDKDACLSPSELANLFSVCPPTALARDALASVETNARGWLTYHGYIAFWNMMAYTNLSQTIELLAYLGFAVGRPSVKQAIRVTRERRLDLAEKSTTRRVFQCLVVAAKDAGKTVFLQSLVGRNLQDVGAMGKRHTPYVCNRVRVKDDDKYLLFREVDVLSPSDALAAGELSADVVCLLYDVSNPDSFAYAATVFLKYFHRTRVPVVVVATKVERVEVEQRYDQQPEDFCRAHELPRPLRFSKDQMGRADCYIFAQLTQLAAFPHLRRVYFLHDSNVLSKITFGAALAALAGFLVYRNM